MKQSANFIALVPNRSFCRVAIADAPVPNATTIISETKTYLDCHETAFPKIVADWRSSKYSHTTPRVALQLPKFERLTSSASTPKSLDSVLVECYECHGPHQTNGLAITTPKRKLASSPGL